MAIYNREDYKTTLPQLEKQLNKFTKQMDGLVDFFYPVGSYYETSDIEFDPSKTWGGEWELETEGQFHISAGENYEVDGALENTTDGGSKDAIVPYHNHTQNAHGHSITNSSYVLCNYSNVDRKTVNNGSGASNMLHSDGATQRLGISASNNTATNNATGESVTDKNLPPYIIVNRWHRIA